MGSACGAADLAGPCGCRSPRPPPLAAVQHSRGDAIDATEPALLLPLPLLRLLLLLLLLPLLRLPLLLLLVLLLVLGCLRGPLGRPRLGVLPQQALDGGCHVLDAFLLRFRTAV